MSPLTLRITVEENPETMILKLEGRLAAAWVAELDQLWEKIGPARGARSLVLDLRETTYADPKGIRALRSIYLQTGASILTRTPWTQYLAEEVQRNEQNKHQHGEV